MFLYDGESVTSRASVKIKSQLRSCSLAMAMCRDLVNDGKKGTVHIITCIYV